jgi:hypothetical protein
MRAHQNGVPFFVPLVPQNPFEYFHPTRIQKGGFSQAAEVLANTQDRKNAYPQLTL